MEATKTVEALQTAASKVSGEYDEKEFNGIKYKKAKDITKDNIELTYYHFDQDETVQYLADRFQEIYPNIKVHVKYQAVSKYNDSLLTMVSNKESPDVIMFSDADFALSNMLVQDISSYWNSDPETKELASTVNDCGLGCYGTDKRYAVPVKFFPGVMYVDRNVLTQLNVKEPARNWTWDDMINSSKIVQLRSLQTVWHIMDAVTTTDLTHTMESLLSRQYRVSLVSTEHSLTFQHGLKVSSSRRT